LRAMPLWQRAASSAASQTRRIPLSISSPALCQGDHLYAERNLKIASIEAVRARLGVPTVLLRSSLPVG
jgi:hypothetical protein